MAKKISLQTAKLSIEKGFEILGNQAGFIMNNPNCLQLPTQDDLHEWLRKEHKIFINMKHIVFNQKFGYSITGAYQNGEQGVLKSYDWTKFESWEECLEDALVEALNFIK